MSDGAGARTFSEEMDYDVRAVDKVLGTLVSATKTASIAVFANQSPPENLKDLAGRTERAAAADRRAEQRPRRGAQPRLRTAAGDAATLWEIPEAEPRRRPGRRGRRSTSSA